MLFIRLLVLVSLFFIFVKHENSVFASNINIAQHVTQNNAGYDEVDKLMDLGRQSVSKGNYKEAITYFNKVVTLEPGFAMAHLWLGTAYFNDRNFTDSVTALTKAKELAGNDVVVNARSLFFLGRVSREKKENDQAIQYYKEAISLEPNVSGYYSYLGEIYFEKELFKEAAENYKKEIQLNHNSLYGYNNLGQSLFRLGNYKEAINVLEKHIKLHPEGAYKKGDYTAKDAHVYTILGDCYQKIGDNAKAKTAYRKINHNPALHFKIAGDSYTNSKDKKEREKGIENYRRLLLLDPNHAAGHYNLGHTLVLLERYDEAGVHLLKAVDLYIQDGNFPDASSAEYILAESFYAKDRYDNAIKHSVNAAKLNHTSDLPFDLLGRVYFRLNDYSNASQVYKRTRKLNPGNMTSRAYYQLGISLTVIGEFKEAEKVFSMSVNAYPTDRALQEWLAVARYLTDGLGASEERWKLFNSGTFTRDVKIKMLESIYNGLFEIAERAEKKKMSFQALDHYVLAHSFLLNFTNIDKYSSNIRKWVNDERDVIRKRIYPLYRGVPMKPSIPSEAIGLANEAQNAINREEFGKARDYYQRAIEIAPFWPEVHYNLALLLGAEWWPTPWAIREMRIYLELEPNGKLSYSARQKLNEWDERRRQYAKDGLTEREDLPFFIAPDLEYW